MAAGLASMQLLTQEAVARLEALGERLRGGLTEVFARQGWEMQVTGAGSMFRVHPHRRKVTGYRSAHPRPEEKARLGLLRAHLQANGVLVTPNVSGALTTVMTEAEIDFFVQVVAGCSDQVAETKAA
jgi:glutamate-1-semialdehyde 2,1-aminomutase